MFLVVWHDHKQERGATQCDLGRRKVHERDATCREGRHVRAKEEEVTFSRNVWLG